MTGWAPRRAGRAVMERWQRSKSQSAFIERTGAPVMPTIPRRVVPGHDDRGVSVFAAGGPLPVVRTDPTARCSSGEHLGLTDAFGRPGTRVPEEAGPLRAIGGR
jgi:hypothetical protein